MTSTSVLAVSGALGFFVVALGFPDWQVAVESAQVVGGLVDYPRDNPFFIYHLKLWTVLHQVCAVALRAGMPESTLSMLLTGVQGMVTFQAIAMFVYALSRDALLALSSVAFVIVSGTANVGATYPIFLLGTVHTYGALGLSLMVLTAGLIGSGHHRLGLFLAGLAPSIHPSLGLWLGIILVLCFLMDIRRSRRLVVDAWPWFAAGCAVTAMSLTIHLWMTRGIPPVPAEVASRYLSAFTALWDEHRQPVPFDRIGVWINVAALILAAAWLFIRRDVFILRFVVISAAASLAFVLGSWIPPDRLPSTLVMLMPTRLLNVNAMTFTALVIGLAGSLRWTWARWTTVALCVLLVAGHRSMLWEWLQRRGGVTEHFRLDPAGVLAVATLLLIGVALIVRSRATKKTREADGSPWPPWPLSEPIPWPDASRVTLAALAVVVVWIGAGPVRASDRGSTVYRDRTNDLLFQAAARGRGLLLTGGDLYLIQLRTRRPILLNGGALDSLPYALESAPAMDRILRDVYGIDLFHPPPGAARMAVIPNAFNRDLWLRYPAGRWQQIKRDYNVTQVMVPSDWELQLPIVAQSRQYLLYEIP